MGRKPDEIKKGLECCTNDECREKCVKCPYFDGACGNDLYVVEKDALALIQQLEATVSEKEKVVAELSGIIGQLEANNKLLQDAVDQWELVAASPGAVEDMARENTELLEKVEQLQAERDAAVADLEHVKDCDSCKYDDACFT